MIPGSLTRTSLYTTYMYARTHVLQYISLIDSSCWDTDECDRAHDDNQDSTSNLFPNFSPARSSSRFLHNTEQYGLIGNVCSSQFHSQVHIDVFLVKKGRREKGRESY